MDDPDNFFELTFSGRIAEGADPETVRSSAVRLFRLSPEEADQLFSGATIILKKKLPEAAADNYRIKLIAVGLICAIRPMTFVQQPPQAEAPAPEVAAKDSIDSIVMASDLSDDIDTSSEADFLDLQETATLTDEESEDTISPWIDAVSEEEEEPLPTMDPEELEDADFPPELTNAIAFLSLENHEDPDRHKGNHEENHETSHPEAIDMDADYFDDLLNDDDPEEILLTAEELETTHFNDEIVLAATEAESEELSHVELLPDDAIAIAIDIFEEVAPKEEIVFPEEEAMFTEAVLEADKPEGSVEIPTKELDWSLSPVGAPIEPATDEPPTPPIPDSSHISLKEQTGYLLEPKTTEAPPPPDTSHLSLAD